MLFMRDIDPWQEMERIQNEMSKLFSEQSYVSATFPPINVWANDEKAVITSELPGMSADELRLTVRNDLLSLEGERKKQTYGEDCVRHRVERGEGQFKRTVRLPFHVDREKIDAQFNNGCLTITLPRAEEDKPKKIDIQIGK
ncbi:Hsp20/alpha crystallin family protein [candidate division KSB1 bacterium]|nr:Hsp20/alpha crystallin family protein [candidate division KSB1 bacterium]